MLNESHLENILSLLIDTFGEKTVREKLDKLTTRQTTWGDFREMLDHLNSRMGIESET